MRSKKTALFLATCILASSPLTHADETLEHVLLELKAVRAQLSALEARIEALESQPVSTEPTQTAEPVKLAEKKSWIDSMRIELKKADVRASGAWTKPDVWNSVEIGMKTEEVIDLLGKPTSRKFSVRKDTDEILFYQGDLEGSGKPVKGELRIYKGKVRRFVVPVFPAGA